MNSSADSPALRIPSEIRGEGSPPTSRQLAHEVWLVLRNDLRLMWRDMQTGRWKDFASVALFVVLFLIANAIAITLFFVVGKQPPLSGEMLAWLFFGLAMLGTAMNQAVSVLFERADFDLLLSSPISSRAILLARLGTMSAAAAGSVAVFLLPLVNGALLSVSPGYVSGYAVWLLLSCAVASLGIVGTLIMVRWLGARRARTAAQVIAAVLGAGLYLGFQAMNSLPDETRTVVATWSNRFVNYSGASLVARAGRGELLPLLTVAGVTLGLAAATTRMLARLFIDGVQEAGAAVSPSKSRSSSKYTFSDGLFRATFRKDVRLILRDPLLLAQILPTALYIVPALLGFVRYGAVVLIGPVAVFIAAQFSYALTLVAASGEECWDLIRMSPAAELKVRHAKMAAGMALPVAVSGAASVAVAVLGAPGVALLTLVISIACAAACSWLQVTQIRPSPRRDILRRNQGRRSVGRSFGSALIMLAGASAVGLAGAHKFLASSIMSGITVVIVIACFTLVRMEEIQPAVIEPGSSEENAVSP